MMNDMLAKFYSSQTQVGNNSQKQETAAALETTSPFHKNGRENRSYNDHDENKGQVLLSSHKSFSGDPANLLSTFFKLYFDFSYALCCSPFRFTESEECGGNTKCTEASQQQQTSKKYFRIKSSPYQKTISGVVNLFGLYAMFTDTRKVIPKATRSRNPLGYFLLIHKLLAMGFQLKTFHTLWFRQEQFLDILNFLKETRIEFQGGRKKIRRSFTTRRLACVVCTLYAVMALTQVLWTKLVVPYDSELIPFARYMFFVSSRNSSGRVKKEEIYGVDIFLGVLTGIGWLGRFISGFYTDLWLLFGVLTVWMASYTLAEKLKEKKRNEESSGIYYLGQFAPMKDVTAFVVPFQQERVRLNCARRQHNWVEIYREYQVIRKVTQLVNKAYGASLTIYLAYSLLFDSISMDRIFVTKEPSEKLQTVFFFCGNICLCVFAADSFKQLDTLRMWLGEEENRRDISDEDEMYQVVKELETKSIGLRASGIFTVTYSVLWNMLTTAITYFIICLQSLHDGEADVTF